MSDVKLDKWETEFADELAQDFCPPPDYAYVRRMVRKLLEYHDRRFQCKMKLIDMYGEGGYTFAECSDCGAQFTLPESRGDADREVLPHEFDFCPACGSEVVEQ